MIKENSGNRLRRRSYIQVSKAVLAVFIVISIALFSFHYFKKESQKQQAEHLIATQSDNIREELDNLKRQVYNLQQTTQSDLVRIRNALTSLIDTSPVTTAQQVLRNAPVKRSTISSNTQKESVESNVVVQVNTNNVNTNDELDKVEVNPIPQAPATTSSEKQLIAYPPGVMRPYKFAKESELQTGHENPRMLVYVVGGWTLSSPTFDEKCVVRCTWTVEQQFESQADALFWEGMRMGGGNQYAQEKPADKPLQKRVLFSMESDSYYPHQKSNEVMGKMDVSMTYRLDNHWDHLKHLDFVPGPYFSNPEYSHFIKARPGMWKKSGFVLWAHNNCGAISKRQEVVKALMQKGLDVHSYGSCLHNKDHPKSGQQNLVELLATYKFYLMFENVFDDYDWVSSTYFRAIDAGAVPVYMGAPNIDKFAPSNYSIIKANEFDTMEDLIEYLNFLDNNDDEYYKYLQWKKDGPSEDFRKLMSLADIHSRCRLCMYLANLRKDKYSPAIQKILEENEQYRKEFFELNARLNKQATHSASYIEKTRQWTGH